MGASVRYGETAALIRGLMLETGSHLVASLQEWEWAASMPELISIMQAEAYINSHLEEGTPRVNLPRPWGSADDPAKVSEEEFAALVARLDANSAFRDS